nr:MAG TPA: hypothetical protein [Inoviridae sp.]DAS90802.1 MAG TPA: hypothetical protein [Inoviridae sp.]DAU43071.1 MAG TPA: hypothetical protein [Inoviridae sp.]
MVASENKTTSKPFEGYRPSFPTSKMNCGA